MTIIFNSTYKYKIYWQTCKVYETHGQEHNCLQAAMADIQKSIFICIQGNWNSRLQQDRKTYQQKPKIQQHLAGGLLSFPLAVIPGLLSLRHSPKSDIKVSAFVLQLKTKVKKYCREMELGFSPCCRFFCCCCLLQNGKT